jgi:hypothetical protein
MFAQSYPSSVATSPLQSTIGGTQGQAAAANPKRKRIIIQNTGTTVLYVGYGDNTLTLTTSNYHVALKACGVANDGTSPPLVDEMWAGAVQILSSAGGGTYVLTELT